MVKWEYQGETMITFLAGLYVGLGLGRLFYLLHLMIRETQEEVWTIGITIHVVLSIIWPVELFFSCLREYNER